MKFSKLLTTAMMSVALVVSSSAFAAEETPWWSMNFDGLSIEEGGSLTNTLNTAYGIDQNGVWSTEEGDLSSLADGKLVLNTQGTDLTWTPNGDNDETAITYIDADVTFVGSDTAPTISETDVHTAVFLKNNVDDTTGEVTNSVLCAWVRLNYDTPANWIELSGSTISDGETHSLRIMLEGKSLSFYLDDELLTASNGAVKLLSAKDGSEGEVDSVSFRGTGYVDNFAASQEAAAVIETASITGDKVFLDNVDVTADWTYFFYLNEEYNGQTVQLTGDAYNTATIWNVAKNPDTYQDLGPIAAIKLVSDTQSFEIVYDSKTGTFSGDATLSVNPIADEYGTMYEVWVDTDELDANAEYTLEFYYGEYTPSEDPDPVQLGTPSVTATTTANSVTLTWTAIENATRYEVTFNGETTTVTDATFTVSNLTASTDYSYSVVAKGDGVNYTDSAAASGTATTATPAEPEPEFAPVAVAAIAIDGTTATLTIEGEYTEVKVLFCETLGGEWVEVEATFADGVATVPATTATGFFKVEAK